MSDSTISEMTEKAIAKLRDCQSFNVYEDPNSSAHFNYEVGAEIARLATAGQSYDEIMGLVDDVRPIMGSAVDQDMTVLETEYILEEQIMGYHILKLAFFNLIQHSAEAVAGGEKQREKLAALLRQIRSRIDNGEFD